MPKSTSEFSPRVRPKLPRLSNKQYEEVDRLLQADPKHADECPTCRARAVEVAPGIYDWAPSVYFYQGKTHLCDCVTQRALFRHYLLAHIPEEYMRLDKEDYVGDDDALQEMFAFLDKWESFKRHGMGLGFYSQKQGTGKTMLATYLARELVKRQESVYFVTFLHIIGLYQAPYEDRKDEEERLRDCTVLVLDEIVPAGTSAQHALFAERFEELIRHRSNYNRVTILTTNLEPDELDREYPRIFSLLDAKQKHIQIAGGDLRRGEDGIYNINQNLVLNDEVRPIK